MSSVTPPEKNRPRSISATIMLLVTLSSSLLLTLFAVFHHSIFERQQREEHARYFGAQLHFIRAELEEQFEADKDEGDELEEIRDSILRENASRRHGRFYVQVADERGESLMLSNGIESFLRDDPPFPTPAPRIDETKTTYWESSDSRHFVLSSVRIQLEDGRARQLNVALDWSEQEDQIETFRRISFGAILIGALLSAVAAAAIARQALRPVEAIAAAADGIRAGSFDASIEDTQWPRELAVLAASFAEMQDRLRDSFDRLSQFAADLAHELRTPINNMMGESEVALTMERSPEEYRAVIESTLEESNRLSRTIDSLLFLARAEQGSSPLHAEILDLVEEAEAVTEYHQAEAEDLEVKIEIEGSATLQADQSLLRRAMSNLLSNALQASTTGGRVVISIHSLTDHVEVKVADNGSGIPREELSSVFTRFYRSPQARLARSGGSGLGLAIVRSIVELHGGNAHIESAPGDGTTVTLSFPREPRMTRP